MPPEFLAAGLEPQRDPCSPAPPSGRRRIRTRRPKSGGWNPTPTGSNQSNWASRCFGQDEPGDYLERRTAARRRLTQAGRGAWFGAFAGGRLLAQLGLFDAGDGYARYQHVETDPQARRQGLAGTLVWHAGRYGREALGAATFVIVADPADVAIRVYRACGFADTQRQFGFERPAEDDVFPGKRVNIRSSVTIAETSSAGVMSNA